MTNDAIAPDTKDWTWVLERPCPECGYDAAAIEPTSLPARIRSSAEAWRTVLERADATVRPQPEVWSPTEYACHVRDMHQVFGGRVRLMRLEDGASFANWDQDVAAAEGEYATQEPATVLAGLLEAAEAAAAEYEAVPDDAWGHRGLRSNGSEFTLTTIGQYHLHDAVHHLVDVGVS